MRWLLVLLLKGYRLVVSPLYGQSCRYYPTCSAYALRSVETHGATKGSWLAVRRLGRCHPWCEGGVDLVPSVESYRWWGLADGVDGSAGAPPSHAADNAPTASRSGSPSSADVSTPRGA